MKKIKYILGAIVLVSLTLQSCSEDKMDDINKNKNDPETMESKYIITDVMTSTGFTTTGSDLAFYASVYTEQLGGGHGQLYQAQIREGEPTSAVTYNNQWNNLYLNLLRLDVIMRKCSVGGEEEGNYHTLGIAQILRAYNLGVLTDLFGDVPYSEAVQPTIIMQPKVDKQEDLYIEIFNLLDQAIVNLNTQTTYPALGKQDVLYTGENVINNWIKTAYGLKARYTMRLSGRTPNYQGVIDYVDNSFTSASEELVFSNIKVDYSFYRFAGDRAALFGSQTLYDIIKSGDENDPRLKLEGGYFTAVEVAGDNNTSKQALVLIDHSKAVTQSQSFYSPSALSDRGNSANSSNAIYLLSFHELKFLKSEAQARLGLESESITTLQEGVDAALVKKQSLKYPLYKREIPKTLTGKDLLKRIAGEKFIAFSEVESIEMYNEIRRWKGMGEDLIPLQHKDPNLFPLRFTYGLSDYTSNPNITNIFGDGTYVYSQPVWWAGGSN